MAPRRRSTRQACGARVAELVRRARLDLGWSGRELARAAGLPQSTVSRVERGEAPSSSRLARLARALPGLDPDLLLAGALRGPAPASARTWTYFRDVLGCVVRESRLEARVEDGRVRVQLRVSGVRSLCARTSDPDTCTALAGSVLVGSAAALFRSRIALADIQRGELTIDDGDVQHHFRFPRSLETTGFDYVRDDRLARDPLEGDPLGQLPHARPFAVGTSLWFDYPVRRVVFRVTFADRAQHVLRVHAWPASAAVDAGRSAECWARLRPAAPRTLVPDARGRGELRVERPLPGTCLGLSWDGEAAATTTGRATTPCASPAVAPLPRARSTGDVLADERRRCGLSVRQVAALLGRSPASVSELERGAEPRAETLARYLEVLPGLSAHELLGHPEPAGPVDADEAWRFQRALFGMEAREEERTCRVTADGDMRGTFRTLGLTWTREAASDLRLRHGLARVPEGADWKLDEISTEREEDEELVRVRVLRRGRGPVLHDLHLQDAGGRRRVSFTRRVHVSHQFALTQERSLAAHFGALRTWEALYAEPSLPARRLRFDVWFPEGHVPLNPDAGVYPRGAHSTTRARSLAERVHGDAFRFLDAGERQGLLRIVVDRPLVGLRYMLRWQLPA